LSITRYAVLQSLARVDSFGDAIKMSSTARSTLTLYKARMVSVDNADSTLQIVKELQPTLSSR
jgi:hypothetical protein